MIIYKITNAINGKIYIGQTIRPLDVRKYEYKRTMTYIKKSNNTYLTNSFHKYGFENFKFEIIDTGKTIEELNEKEIFYIKEYNSTDKTIGYNMESGGRNSSPSLETRKKMSLSKIGKKQTKEWVEKRVPLKGSDEAKKYGRPKTEEERKYISENSPKYWLGKERSEETKRKVSETKKLQALKPVNTKKVKALNIITNEVIDFESTYDAGLHFGINQSTISRRCNGVTKNKGDYIFTFVD